MDRFIPDWTFSTIHGENVVLVGDVAYPVDISLPPVFFLRQYLDVRLRLRPEGAGGLDPAHPLSEWITSLALFTEEFCSRGAGAEYKDLLTPQAFGVLLLAFDMFTLDADRKLQSALLDRLLQRNFFQGALHEVGVAAVMTRSGFELEFEDEFDNRAKHPEFVATHRRTGLRVAVEAKSIHRMGVLGFEGGKPAPSMDTATPHKIAAQVCGQVEKSLPKAPGLPLFVFVDLNLPSDVAERYGPMLQPEFNAMLPQIDSGYDVDGAFLGKAMNLLTVTNRPSQLGEPRSPRGDVLNIFVTPADCDCRFPEANRHIPEVKAAAKRYGTLGVDE
jgi:hypothetical protein